MEYRPYVGDGAYSADALQAWGRVLGAGTPRQALAIHDMLFDRQPDSGSPTPSELVTWAQDAGIRKKSVLAAMAQPDDQLVAAACFRKNEQRLDTWGISTVSLAERI